MNKLIELARAIVALFFRPEKAEKQLQPIESKSLRRLAWGQKVSAAFRERLFEICRELGVEPDYLMACMAFESAETFSPKIKNAAGSGATGLIQFMPATAKGLGTTTDALAAMTAEQQLEYVLAYFWPYRSRLKTIGDVYMAILWPAGIGKPDDWTLWDKTSRPTTYRQNAGLDLNKDGKITKAEAVAKIQAKLTRGQLPQFMWEGE
ncbi:transglycosylase SLT domain-containing protein [Alcaligenes endophyticus]|uniref:Transglycosylase SLT domain-containing protein n=1 Tax=Alcaligenes endophyticus TaxID=1929088 RepID=A0ABT8EKQ9_9BURK|nr:transglycosylase SLT domain-containing protein [Alcaligenes endophyticus]MCX5592010.1 transglycosylase SLT domain-containing protein [Alcaligenes endophyticus]MDN4121700.1 transglycosylase SLT domain-containing protein [Alcaligenes endophyticus]